MAIPVYYSDGPSGNAMAVVEREWPRMSVLAADPVKGHSRLRSEGSGPLTTRADLVSKGLSMILCAIVGVVASLDAALPVAYVCLLFSFVLLCFVAGRNPQTRIVALAFVSMLFLFIVGNAVNVLAWQLEAGPLDAVLPKLLGVVNLAQVLEVYRTLTYCVIGLTVGLLFAGRRPPGHQIVKRLNPFSAGGLTRVPMVLYVALIVSAACSLLRSWDIWRFVGQSSYVSYYVEYTTSLPTIVAHGAIALDVIFFTVLVMVRSGRALVIPTIIYLGASAFTLMTGRRGQFMIPLLIVMVFFFHRAFARPDSPPRHFGGRVVIVLLFVVVPMMVLMQALFGYRTGSSVGLSPLDFLSGQGGSITTVGYVVLLGAGLPDKPYAFGTILARLRGYVCRGDICAPMPSTQSVERVMMTPQLSDTLTYAIAPHAYLSGYGYGSSFVAELLAQFGLIGVFLGSVFYGLLIIAVSRLLSSDSVIPAVFGLVIAQRLFFSPRSGFSDFLLELVSSQNLVWLSCVLLIMHWRPRRQVSSPGNGSG